MNMPVLKTEPKVMTALPSAEVLRIAPPKPSFVRARLLPALGDIAANVLPPLVMLLLILAVWQILCMKPGATLPSPTKIWSEAKDLIVDPFFVAGPQDIGLGWRVLVSLQRVAIGYGFAAVIGIMLGTIIGQSMWAMRGLDPIFLLAPTSHRARVKAVARAASGFVYYVSRTGVTGERAELPCGLEQEVAALRKQLKLPVAVGFGISSPEQVAAVAKVADGVVVGSALVRLVAEHGGEEDLPELLGAVALRMVAATRRRGRRGRA